MALINCPGCNHQVSERAASCPSCGEPIRTAPPRREPKSLAPTKERGIFMQFMNCGCWVVLVLVGLAILGIVGGVVCSK